MNNQVVPDKEDFMINDINTITDRGSFDRIINDFFIGKKVYAKVNGKNVEVKFLKQSVSLPAVRFPAEVNVPDKCLIFTRHKNAVICAHLSKCSQKNNIYTFNPIKFQILTADRKEERMPIGKIKIEKRIIFATNIMTDFLIFNSLEEGKQKIKRIKEIIQYDNGHNYDFLKIFFCNEGMNDPRMKYFYKERTPIFIADINKKEDDKKRDRSKEYIYNIIAGDSHFTGDVNYTSEVSVPILLNEKIPYGYLQVNSTNPLSASVLPVVMRIASMIEQLTQKCKIFSALNNKLLISDISQRGLGAIFQEKDLIPHYRENSYVTLDMMLPSNKKASLLADVRHLDIMQNNVFKVGFEIKDMDTMSMDNYDKFLRYVNGPGLFMKSSARDTR